MSDTDVTTFEVDFKAHLVFDRQAGDILGEIPWHRYHQLRNHCLELSKQETVGRLLQWLAAAPEVDEIRASVEIDHEYDDQGGTYEVVRVTYSPTLNQPLNRVIEIGGQKLDCTDVGDSEDALADLIREAIEDDPALDGFRELASICHSSTIAISRSDFADLLAKPSISLKEVLQRVEQQKQR